MPSFLLNDKMNPALRARVERSLSGRSPSSRLPPRFVAALRLLSIATLLAAVGWTFSASRERAARLVRAKSELLEKLQQHARQLGPEDWQTVPRAERWLQRATEPYPGDLVALAAHAPEDLARELARRAAYVRAEFAELGPGKDLQQSLSNSTKDAFLACFLEPPVSTMEKDLLAHVARFRRGELRGGENIAGLGAAVVALPLLTPAWAAQLEYVETLEALHPLRQLVEQAPLAEARRAAAAELLILVVDEPREAGVPVELDGTARHAVRLFITDLRAERELVRVRRTVDPAWISEAKRPQSASALVDCRLGFDVRAALVQG